MRVIWKIVIFWCSFATACFGQADVYDRLYDALHLEKIVKILHDEGVEDALESGKNYLGLVEALPKAKAEAALRFFSKGLGAQAALLETSARSAISYEEVKVSAIQLAKELKSANTVRYLMLEKNIKDLELVELNMTGAFSAQYAFLSNLSALADMPLTKGDIVALLLESEDEMRQEIVDWLMGFMHMAYTPLSDEELKTYLSFLSSSDGKVLNKTLFYIFNDLAVKTSGDLADLIVLFRRAREL